jgi:acyl-CoA dehydrogenase
MREMSIVFEEAGRHVGPLALNCSAPDEGNMHLLELVATEAQKGDTCGLWSRGRSHPASR